MPTHVKFKFKDKGRVVGRSKVAEICFGDLNVPLTKIFDTNDGYKAVCKDDEDADKLLTTRAVTAFDNNGLVVVMPPELRAKRSVIARGIDYVIGNQTPDEIKDSIEYHNSWSKIEEVVKFKDYTHVFKIRFTETRMAEKAAQDGFLINNMAVTPQQVEREEFISLLICFQCYRYEEHTTNDCPNKETKMCSECANTGHTFRECNNTAKQCINCNRYGSENANHRTLAMSCPIKKQLVKNKKEEMTQKKEDKQNSSYATIVKKTIAEVKEDKKITNIHLTEETHFTLLACIMHSHVLNLQKPGCYNSELNKMLKLNNLPTLKFPDDPDSESVLGAKKHEPEATYGDDQRQQTAEPEEMDTDRDEEDIQYIRDPRITKKMTKVRPRDESVEVETTKRRAKQTKHKETTEIPTVKEMNLRIHVKVGTGIPTATKPDSIAQGIRNGKMKYTYTNEKYKEQLVDTLIKSGRLITKTSDYQIYEDPKFDTIRNGYCKLKTNRPP